MHKLLRNCELHFRPPGNERREMNMNNHRRRMDRSMKVQTRKYVPVPDVVSIEQQGGVIGTPELQCSCSQEIVTNLPKIN